MKLHFKSRAVLLVFCYFFGCAHVAQAFALGGNDALGLDIPVNCNLGVDCFIQNYFDHTQGVESKDYTCGSLTYDNHSGTDFRLKNFHEILKGVNVIASANGLVVGVRDGEPDIAISVRGMKSVIGREAGNGVVIDHGYGWKTQYSHLKNGSVRVKVGQYVVQGEPIGLVGESGNADFPHLDFGVRKDGNVVDPFAPNTPFECGVSDLSSSLWTQTAKSQLGYQSTGVLLMGFSDKAPGLAQIDAFNGTSPPLSRDLTEFVFWAELFGVKRDDEILIGLSELNGTTLNPTLNRTIANGNYALLVVALSTVKPSSGWHGGIYRGTLELYRKGEKVLMKVTEGKFD